jgi:serine/threonine protein kinase
MATRYGSIQRKQPIIKQNSFVQPKLLKRYPLFIKKELQSRYGKGVFSDSRALQVLFMNEFELARNAPPWVVRIQTVINNYASQIDILGGGLKDIILFGNYAYTFHIPRKQRKGEKGYDYLARVTEYEHHIENLSAYFSGLDNKVKDRLNFATANNIYAQEFVEKGTLSTRRVIITKVPMCEQSDLTHFVLSKQIKTFEDKVRGFLTLVYDTTKVLKILHEKGVYVLDIKPDNIFVCSDRRNKGFKIKDGQQGYTFSFGDLDMAQICNEYYGNEGCQSKLATLYYLPTNAFSNPNDFRNLYGARGYAIRDAYALSKTLLAAFNMLMVPQDFRLFNENKYYEWEQAPNEEQARAYNTYMYQNMSNKVWQDKMEGRRTEFREMAEKVAAMTTSYEDPTNLVAVVNELFDLMLLTSETGRPVEKRGKAVRLANWDEMPTAEDLHKRMEKVKNAARKAGAKTWKRTTAKAVVKRYTGFGNVVEEELMQQPLSDGFCRYSKGSCKRKVKDQLKF